ncbi:MAG: VOC family protein [Deltaproteobacteria bacterium]|nr:VOC family protein [Deltaproteobacteria bacterium]
MGALGVGAVVLWSPRAEEMRAFYSALGLVLEDERHDEDGPLHWACDLRGTHFAIFATQDGAQSPGWRRGGGILIGFDVDHLDATVARVRALGAEVLQEPEDVPWGRRAVVRDPDGRGVEITERS